jgi:hypothetical protein
MAVKQYEELTERERMKITLEWLSRRGFTAKYARNKGTAREMIRELVPENWIVGFGDSATVRSTGIIKDLVDAGNRVLNPFVRPRIMRENPKKLPLRVMKQTSQQCDVFVSSSNAVTLDGKLVNIDGGGMRVTGQVFGPLRSIMVVGKNKIVEDVEMALDRIKNVIAPSHAKFIGANWGVPCASKGRCIEPESFCVPGPRICNIIVILEGQPNTTDIEIVVILVDEDLGLGWDPKWPQERKDKIYAGYKKFTPPHRPINRDEVASKMRIQ